MARDKTRPFAIGRHVGRYRIEALLGVGGMGIVYRAKDRRLRRTVAIKVLDRMDADAKRSLLHEAQIGAALSHPSICSVHEVGYSGDLPFIVMEHVNGSPLSGFIRPGEGLPIETAFCYAIQIVDGVAHAHSREIVHCDLKGSNIMVTSDSRVKILDFGLAVRQVAVVTPDAETTRPKERPSGGGTVPYMAPEVLRGHPADARSDIWSLGVLLYEMTSGTRPFRGNTQYEMAAAILADPPIPLPPHVPAGLKTLISRCLSRSPGDRYRSGTELAAALDDLA